MLWLPDRKTLKALARQKRRRRRRRIARVLLFLFLLFGLGTASVPPSTHLLTQVQTATTPYQFDFIDWESQVIAGEIGRRIWPPALPPTPVDQRKMVDQYLALEEEIRHLEDQIDQLYAAAADPQNLPAQATTLQQQLAQLNHQQAQMAPQVETILSKQVESVLHKEGFTLANQVFPPVAFRLIDPPTALILSPRDRIENRHFVGLQPNLGHTLRFELETTIDRRGDVSSYVTDVGGLGSYPTMVIKTPNLVALIDIVAHEWTHNYLFTFPTNMAWGYQTYPRLTTINETTATLVGKEISRKVIQRYYPDWADRLPPVDDSGLPVPRQPSEVDQAMRRIRLKVDQLLANGHIEAAEAYMEQERLKLVEKGYHLRKLNQAYFAFHGSYAFGPASVDPTGQELRQLRAASGSLKSFLDGVGWLNSYGDYLACLNRAGLKQAPASESAGQ